MTDHPTEDLNGARVLVTGGAKGIGAAISRRVADAGAEVLIVDRDADAGTRLARDLGGRAAAVDVADYAAVRDCVADAGPIDVLVNNAGWDRVEPFLDNDPALWDRLLGINLKGQFHFCHTALPGMIERGRGRIVNLASDAGRVGSSGEVVYSACKGGSIAFTKALAREIARHGITVNCVCPGPTDTPLLAEIKQDDRAAGMMDAIVRATPLRRLAQPAEVAEAVVFFAAGPGHVTGQVLSVSGGLTMAG